MGVLAWVSLYADQDMTAYGFASWWKFLGDSFYLNVMFDTLMLGFKTVAGTVVLGLALALLYLESGPNLRRIMLIVIVLPLLTSVVVRTFAWIVILGREGLINGMLLELGLIGAPLRLLQTEWGLVLALMQIELPLMMLPLLAVMNRIDTNLLDASTALGASRLRTFWKVILPLSLPGLAAGCLLVFASSTAAFISQSVIGGGRLIYMPLVIWQQSVVVYNWPFAAAVSIALLISVLAVIALFARLGQMSRVRLDG